MPLPRASRQPQQPQVAGGVTRGVEADPVLVTGTQDAHHRLGPQPSLDVLVAQLACRTWQVEVDHAIDELVGVVLGDVVALARAVVARGDGIDDLLAAVASALPVGQRLHASVDANAHDRDIAPHLDVQVGRARGHCQRDPALEQLHRAALGRALARRACVAQYLAQHLGLGHQFAHHAVATRPQCAPDGLCRAIERQLLGRGHRGAHQSRLTRAAVERDQLLVQQGRQLIDRFRADGQQRLVGRQLVEMHEDVRANLGVSKDGRRLDRDELPRRVPTRHRRRRKQVLRGQASIKTSCGRSRGGRGQRARQATLCGAGDIAGCHGHRGAQRRSIRCRRRSCHRFGLLTTTQHLEQPHGFTAAPAARRLRARRAHWLRGRCLPAGSARRHRWRWPPHATWCRAHPGQRPAGTAWR